MALIIQTLREGRGLRRSDVAEAMGLHPRTYDRFEDGQGSFEPDRIFRFAEVTQSDPFCIIIALLIGQPDFAWRCADNKVGMITIAMLQHLNEELGDDLTFIDSTQMIAIANRTVVDLKDYLLKRDMIAEQWFDQRAKKLNLKISLNGLRLWFGRKATRRP